MAERLEISVVVPTRDRPEALRRCLHALARQTVPIEVVVVDDGSRVPVAGTVDEFADALDVTPVRRSGAGPAAARNAGARASGGELIIFLDDDCEPERGWAARLAAACPPDGSAAGETVNVDPGNLFASASQLLTSELQRRSLTAAGTLAFTPSSNLAMSRELFDRLPFDESYPLAGGEDRAWCAAAARLGAAPVYVPDAVVRHRQELAGLAGFWRQQVRYGRGAARLRRDGFRLAGPSARLSLIRAGLGKGVRIGALLSLAQIAVALGFVLEALQHRTSLGTPHSG